MVRGASALHGRRVGKPLAPYRLDLIDRLLPQLSIDLGSPIEPERLFTSKPKDVWLEVGFGAGEHLLAAARAHPDVGFIGCEPFLNGMARALSELAAADLENIRLHCGDAGEIVAALPPACLGRVSILYPDPWPKRRQRKRRFVSDAMVAALARVMRPGGELRFATDIDDYCGWTLARILHSQDFRWTARRAVDWQQPWPGWPGTRYERKALAQGRRGCYLTAIRG